MPSVEQSSTTMICLRIGTARTRRRISWIVALLVVDRDHDRERQVLGNAVRCPACGRTCSPSVSISHSRRSASLEKPPMGGLRPAAAGAGPSASIARDGAAGGAVAGLGRRENIHRVRILPALRLDRSPGRGVALAARTLRWRRGRRWVGSRKPGIRISDGPGQGKVDRTAVPPGGGRRARAAAPNNADGPQPDEGAASSEERREPADRE